MKKSYILLLVFFLGLNTYAQLETKYEVDFLTTLTDGQPIGDLKELGLAADESDWIGANHPASTDQNWAMTIKGLTPPNWRGANLSGVQLTNWVPDTKVQFTVDVSVGALSNQSGNETLFGITERIPEGGNSSMDSPTSNTNYTMGFQLKDVETQFTIVMNGGSGSTSILYTDLVESDQLRFIYEATKSATLNTFDVILTIQKKVDASYVTITDGTLSTTVTNSIIYGSNGELLTFTGYSKKNLGTISNYWTGLKVEKEESSFVLPVISLGDDFEVVSGAQGSLNAVSNYDDNDDATIIYNWDVPEDIVLSATDIANPTFIAPNLNRAAKYLISLSADVSVGGETYTVSDEVTVTVLPVGGKYQSGDGSADNPFIIQTADQLFTFSVCFEDWAKSFKLGASIDLTDDDNFTPIGNSTAKFAGVFDGDYNTIKGLRIEEARSGEGAVRIGFFAEINNGVVVKNLTLVDPYVVNEGTASTGAFVGYLADPNSSIQNSMVIGGIVSSYGKAGAFAGECGLWSSSVEGNYLVNCVASCVVIGETANGLLGSWANGSTGKINLGNTVFTGAVKMKSTQEDVYTGNGNATFISDVNLDDSKLAFSEVYFIEGSGMMHDVVAGEIELTKAEVSIEGSYGTFDFDNIWEISTDYSYAVLQGFSVPSGITTIEDRVAEAQLNLNIEGDLDNVSTDLVLPYIQDYAEVAWTSDAQDVIAVDGAVTQPIGVDVEVTLTATINLGAYTLTKDFDITVLKATSTDLEVSNKVKVSVYPNPVRDILYINNAIVNEYVVVYNATGGIVKQVLASDESLSIDMSSQSTGVYIVKVGTEAIRVLKK